MGTWAPSLTSPSARLRRRRFSGQRRHCSGPSRLKGTLRSTASSSTLPSLVGRGPRTRGESLGTWPTSAALPAGSIASARRLPPSSEQGSSRSKKKKKEKKKKRKADDTVDGADTTADLTADDADLTAGGEEPAKKKKKKNKNKENEAEAAETTINTTAEEEPSAKKKKKKQKDADASLASDEMSANGDVSLEEAVPVSQKKKKRTRRDHFESC